MPLDTRPSHSLTFAEACEIVLGSSRDLASPADAALAQLAAPEQVKPRQRSELLGVWERIKAETGLLPHPAKKAWRRYQAELNVVRDVKMYRANPELSAGVSQFFFTGVPTIEAAQAEADRYHQLWLAELEIAQVSQ